MAEPLSKNLSKKKKKKDNLSNKVKTNHDRWVTPNDVENYNTNH